MNIQCSSGSSHMPFPVLSLGTSTIKNDPLLFTCRCQDPTPRNSDCYGKRSRPCILQAILTQLIRWLLSGRHCLLRREERHGLPVQVQGPVWEISVLCLHVQFWVVPARPVGSSTSRPSLDSASSFLERNKPFSVGSPDCLSSWVQVRLKLQKAFYQVITCSADQETLLFTFLWLFS